ncbi:hypothetical protein HAX54_013862 [Datura stramonium]|uniref:Uncharacterized protein n=1 Tax=Datura stramonium TaxID=4076 RepID=A0ABS8TNL5_DATST|nr:hypothetical protein [Datura stramonium]
MGSPPPAGSEKVVLKFRSVNNMVIAPASTGSDNKSGNAVTRTNPPHGSDPTKDFDSSGDNYDHGNGMKMDEQALEPGTDEIREEASDYFMHAPLGSGGYSSVGRAQHF